MKQRILAVTLILSGALSLCACSGNNDFKLDKNDDMTYITIPADLNPSEELPKMLIDFGFISPTKESDGSVTYSIATDDYESFINSEKESIHNYIKQVNEEASDNSIAEVKLNDKMDLITANIKTNEYENSNDDLTLHALALKILHYKAYSGEDIAIKIKLIDAETQSVYDTLTIEM